jgi:DNA-binding response OmpR family regulator
MRDAANLPIFVITSNYTIEKKLRAMDCGADVYEHFCSYVKNNVVGALELLKSKNRWAKRPSKSLRVLTGGDIILSPLRRSVFIKDIKASLTRKEFDILQCLMANNGYVVTHARLLQKVWRGKRKLQNTDVLWRTVNRLRGKLSEISPANKYIEIERGVGYKFSLPKGNDE